MAPRAILSCQFGRAPGITICVDAGLGCPRGGTPLACGRDRADQRWDEHLRRAHRAAM